MGTELRNGNGELEENCLAKFRIRAGGAMGFSAVDYYLYDKDSKHFSTIVFDRSECVHLKSIIRVRWCIGGEDRKRVDSVPESIDGYELEYKKVIY